jgi:hypothetical protein
LLNMVITSMSMQQMYLKKKIKDKLKLCEIMA